MLFSTQPFICFSVDLTNYEMTFDVSLPWMYVEGDYKIEGQILVLPIQGSGDSWSNYSKSFKKITFTEIKSYRFLLFSLL